MLYASHARVHLGNIVANVAAVRETVGPTRAVLVAVKANAYGHGAVPVSRALIEAGAVDYLGVATVPEALELRDAGIHVPILKMSPLFAHEISAAVERNVTLTVASPAEVTAVQQAALALGVAATVHVKFDTGMGRVGARPEDAEQMGRALAECSRVQVEGAFTHFPASDAPAQNPFTTYQMATFTQAVEALEAALGATLRHRHLANSGGVLGHAAAWETMVRPGIMAYGYYPDATTPRTVELRPGVSVASRVSFVKTIVAGTTVGYGRTWTAPHDTQIATVPIGYADGYPRLLSNRADVLIGGHRHRLAGRVCMDQIMVDVGPDASVSVGDEVMLWGRQGDAEITCDEIAEWAETITYEITCGMAPRLTRVYDTVVTEPSVATS